MSEGRTNSVGDCCASICAVGPKWSERYRADVVADTKGTLVRVGSMPGKVFLVNG